MVPLLFFLLSFVQSKAPIHKDVCVLGSGASGMAAAVFLKDRNYDVVVFENDDEIGGQCNTYYFTPPTPGMPNWLDYAVMVWPDTAQLNSVGLGPWAVDTAALVKRFAGSDSILPINFTDIHFTGDSIPVDMTTGFTPGVIPPSPPSTDFLIALQSYQTILQRYPWLTTFNYPDVIPSELLVSFTDFVQSNNLSALAPVFDAWIINAGNGNSDNIYALQGIVQLNQVIMYIFFTPGGAFHVKNGCHSIYTGIQDYLGKKNVLVNFTTKQVVRTPQHNLLRGINSYTGKQSIYTCDNIIVSFSQTLDNMHFLGLDAVERDLFSSVQSRTYYAGVVNVNGGVVNDNLFNIVNTNFTSFLNQPTYPAITETSRLFLHYGPATLGASSPTFLDPNQMAHIIRNNLAHIPAQYANLTLQELDYHDYAPYTCPGTLNHTNNFFTQLKAIQGYRNTFYVGSLATTPGSYAVWNHAFLLVNSSFPPR